MGGSPHGVAVTPLWEQCPGAAGAGPGPRWEGRCYRGVGLISAGGMGWGQEGRGQAVTVTKQQRQGGHRHLKKPQGCGGNQAVLTSRKLWSSSGVSRHEVDGILTKVLLGGSRTVLAFTGRKVMRVSMEEMHGLSPSDRIKASPQTWSSSPGVGGGGGGGGTRCFSGRALRSQVSRLNP